MCHCVVSTCLLTASGSVLEVPMTTFTPVKNALKKITARIRRSFINEDSSGDGLPNGKATCLDVVDC